MKDPMVSHRYAEALLLVGAERNSLDQFVKELEILEKYLAQDQEIIEAEVRSVVRLNPQDFQELQSKLSRATGKRVRLKSIIEPGLIGGIVIKIGDTILDGSIIKRLSILKRSVQNSGIDRLPSLGKAFGEEPEVRKTLEDPQVLPQEKKKVLDRIIKEGIGPVVAGFLYLILEKRRESLYLDIIRNFKTMVDEAKKIVTAEVRSAVRLSADDILRLEGRLSGVTGKKVRLEAVIDRSLIGGMVITVGDAVIDGSVRKKLSLLKKGFSSGSLKG